MRIAIIADIHANLEALEKVCDILQRKQIDQIVCLGDIVGYGANPNECMTIVRNKAHHILLGNHDQAAIDLTGSDHFNPYALASAQWTNQQLLEENKQFLRGLPYTLELAGQPDIGLAGLYFVHASPYQPEEWHYIISSADARDNFAHFHRPICFIGHSHVAGIFSFNPSGEVSAKRGGKIQQGKKYIINVGSIGQPRDGDWRLSFGIFDTEKWSYENVRSEYDVQTASQKILKAGLPRILAERILIGR